MLLVALMAAALAATPQLPADPGYPVILDKGVDWGHVAASRGPTAFYTVGSNLYRGNMWSTQMINGNGNVSSPETDDDVLVFVQSGALIVGSDMWGNSPQVIGDGSGPEVDRAFTGWEYRLSPILLWDFDAWHPGSGDKLDLLPDTWLGRPTVWDSGMGQILFSKYQKRDPSTGQLIEYGVMAVDPKGGSKEMVASAPLSNGWESYWAFMPHTWGGRTAWVGDNDVFVREWDKSYSNAFDAFMNGKDTPLKTGLCKEYFFPRVGGEEGRFVLFTGEGCEDGDRVLYLHDMWTGKTWFVTKDVGNPRTMSDWGSVPYDIRDDVIVYLAPGWSPTDVWLFDIDVSAL